MKKTVLLVLLLIAVVSIFGCSSNDLIITESTTSTELRETKATSNITETIDSKMWFEQYFDFEMKNKPSNEAISRVKVGMRMWEVVEIIGKPHDWGPTQGALTLIWKTIEGNQYMVYVFGVPSDSNHESSLDYLLTNGKIAGPYDITGAFEHDR